MKKLEPGDFQLSQLPEHWQALLMLLASRFVGCHWGSKDLHEALRLACREQPAESARFMARFNMARRAIAQREVELGEAESDQKNQARIVRVLESSGDTILAAFNDESLCSKCGEPLHDGQCLDPGWAKKLGDNDPIM